MINHKKVTSIFSLTLLISLSLSSSWASTPMLDQELDEVTSSDNLQKINQEEMTVTASRVIQPLKHVGSSVSVLTAKDLAVKSHLPLADTLRTLPSVRASNSGGLGKNTAIRIRGEEGYRTLLLIDGINVSDTTAPQSMPRFEHLLNNQFERVEILRGPQGMMYGADAAGVVSVFSKKAQKPLEGDIAFETGSFSTQTASANLRGKNDKAHYSLSLSNISSDGFNARSDDLTELDDDGYKNTTAHFTAGITPSKNMGGNITLRQVDSLTDYDNCDYFTPNFSKIEADDCRADYKNTSGKLSIYYQTEKTKHEVSYASSETLNLDYGTKSNEISSDNIGRIIQSQYIGNTKINNNLALTWGLDNKIEQYENFRYPASYKRDQYGAYLETQASIKEQVFFTLGVRTDKNEDFGKKNSLRASSAYLIPLVRGDLKIKAAAGTGFRAPSLFEIYDTRDNNIDFKAEESVNYETGLELSSNKLQAEITFFKSTISNEIYYDNNIYTYVQSSGDSSSKGFDISAKLLITSQLSLHGNYTFNKTDVDENTGNKTIRALRPEHTTNLSANYLLLDDKLTLEMNYREVRDIVDYDYPDTLIELEDYRIVDVNMLWQAQPELQIYARAQNIFDKDYTEVFNYETAGRSLHAGIRYTF